MRAILIDPEAKTITEVDYNGKLEDIYRLTRCDCVDLVRIGHHVIYVDDEGLLKSGQSFFKLSNYDQPLAGCGLVVGEGDEGEDGPATVSLKYMQVHVRFQA